jgi:hypothetical protein
MAAVSATNGFGTNGTQNNAHSQDWTGRSTICNPVLETQSIFKAISHQDMANAINDVDSWFLSNWEFPDQKSRDKFVRAGFSRVTCLYFPKALPERIRSACKLLTILFLIDGQSTILAMNRPV